MYKQKGWGTRSPQQNNVQCKKWAKPLTMVNYQHHVNPATQRRRQNVAVVTKQISTRLKNQPNLSEQTIIKHGNITKRCSNGTHA